jgi:hypothetical protein
MLGACTRLVDGAAGGLIVACTTRARGIIENMPHLRHALRQLNSWSAGRYDQMIFEGFRTGT